MLTGDDGGGCSGSGSESVLGDRCPLVMMVGGCSGSSSESVLGEGAHW